MFIDDMNMPQVDLYGTQQPIALLKLLLEKGGMYDRGKDLNWKLFKDIVLVAAMGKVCTEYQIYHAAAWQWVLIVPDSCMRIQETW